MTQRTADGSAGDADYGAIGSRYTDYRKPDPRIAALIEQALDGARTVLNVGAGAGSYESTAFELTAVEPSASMRAQRPGHLSAWSFVEPEVGEQYTDSLRSELESGAWDERYGALRQQPYLHGSLVLIRATPEA
jgi:hypothetical protein